MTFGLEWAGRSIEDQRRVNQGMSMRRFLTMYCLPPIVWLRALTDLRNTDLVPVEFGVANLKLKDLLMTAHWFTEHNDYPDLALRFDCSERTVQTKVWKVTRAIAHLKAQKVRHRKLSTD